MKIILFDQFLKNEKLRTETFILGGIILLNFINLIYCYHSGPSADDFCNAMRASKFTILEHIYSQLEWESWTRFFSSIFVPALFHVFPTQSFLTFNWGSFYFFTFFFHAGNIILINLILKIFNLPVFLRLTTITVFALHPIKTGAMFWTTPVFGYVISLFLLLFSSYFIFLSTARKSSVANYWFVFPVLIIPMFSNEQFLPTLFIIILIKYFYLGRNKKQFWVEFSFFVAASIIFVFLLSAGVSATKLNTVTAGKGVHFNVHYIIYSLVHIVYRFIVPPFAYPNDEFVLKELSNFQINGLGILIVGVLLLSVALLYMVMKKFSLYENELPNTSKIYFLVGITGSLLSLAAFSPLLITGYSFESRTLYVPMVGMALSVTGFVGALIIILRQLAFHFNIKLGTRLIATCTQVIIIGIVLTFSITNYISQKSYADAWAIKRELLTEISKYHLDIIKKKEIRIFGLPRKNGPAPVFADPWSLPCALESITGKSVKASTIMPLCLTISDKHNNNGSNYLPFVWKKDSLKLLQGLNVLEPSSRLPFRNPVDLLDPGWVKNYKESVLLNMNITKVEVNANISDLLTIKQINIFTIPQIDEIETEVVLDNSNISPKGVGVFCHHIYLEGIPTKTRSKRVKRSKSDQGNQSVFFSADQMKKLDRIRIGFTANNRRRLNVELKEKTDLLSVKDNTLVIKMGFSQIKASKNVGSS